MNMIAIQSNSNLLKNNKRYFIFYILYLEYVHRLVLRYKWGSLNNGQSP